MSYKLRGVSIRFNDVDQLECIDEGLVEAFDVVFVGRAVKGGEGRLGLREEIFRVLMGGHGSDDKGEEDGAQW